MLQGVLRHGHHVGVRGPAVLHQPERGLLVRKSAKAVCACHADESRYLQLPTGSFLFSVVQRSVRKMAAPFQRVTVFDRMDHHQRPYINA